MPVTSSGNIRQHVQGVVRSLDSPELIESLGQLLAEELGARAPVASGAARDALTVVWPAEKTSTGWAIGVGDASLTGKPSDPTPRGTLREFFNDNPGVRPSAWKYLSYLNKMRLETARRAEGKYGGRGARYANYIWVQEFGNNRAGVVARPFMAEAEEAWRSKAQTMVGDYLLGLSRVQ